VPLTVSLTVTKGTGVTVFFDFARPTRASYPTVTTVAATPTTVTVTWRWAAGAKTTWTYTATSGPITKLGTGSYVCTIPTTTGAGTLQGTVRGEGECTATAQFAITANQPAV
jgi:hypothetical protein